MHNISDREIRKVLAKLYDNPGQARMIVEHIHLRWATIPLSLTMDEYWSNIWRETKLQHKELELIERVREDYLRNREIDEIYEQIIKKSKGNESSPNPSPNSPQRPSTFDKFVATFKKPILYITAGFLYITAGLLLLLNISLLFNILDPMIFLKKLLRYNPVILVLIAGLVVFIISGTLVYDLISMQRKKSYSRLSRSAHRTIVVTCLIVLCIPLFFWRYTTVETGVGLSPTNSHIGVCDGSCIFDTNRLTGKLKQQAANYFQQKQNTLACQYLQWAALGDITEPETTNKELDVARSYAEDATDAEAKIDYENRCTNIQCPCISFVVAVQFIDQGNQNADYINGMSRSIL